MSYYFGYFLYYILRRQPIFYCVRFFKENINKGEYGFWLQKDTVLGFLQAAADTAKRELQKHNLWIKCLSKFLKTYIMTKEIGLLYILKIICG